MKIATWNIERLKHIKDLERMQSICNALMADIFVFTESDIRMSLNYKKCFCSGSPMGDTFTIGDKPIDYSDTERRITIFTNYECIDKHSTFDERTTLCVELETPAGNIIVHGCIIGIVGNRHPSFNVDLDSIVADINRISALGKPMCICGDFNCSFADGYYFTKYARQELQKVFGDNGIKLLTVNRPECIDHIAITERFVMSANVSIEEWNFDKLYSDHKGVAVSFKMG